MKENRAENPDRAWNADWDYMGQQEDWLPPLKHEQLHTRSKRGTWYVVLYITLCRKTSSEALTGRD